MKINSRHNKHIITPPQHSKHCPHMHNVPCTEAPSISIAVVASVRPTKPGNFCHMRSKTSAYRSDHRTPSIIGSYPWFIFSSNGASAVNGGILVTGDQPTIHFQTRVRWDVERVVENVERSSGTSTEYSITLVGPHIGALLRCCGFSEIAWDSQLLIRSAQNIRSNCCDDRLGGLPSNAISAKHCVR